MGAQSSLSNGLTEVGVLERGGLRPGSRESSSGVEPGRTRPWGSVTALVPLVPTCLLKG